MTHRSAVELLARCAVVGLGLGMVQPRLLLDGTPRPSRPACMRAAGAGSQRTSRWDGDSRARDARHDHVGTTAERPPAGGRLGDPGTGQAAAVTSQQRRLDPALRVDGPLPSVLVASARTRPHAPTRGRAPPL